MTFLQIRNKLFNFNLNSKRNFQFFPFKSYLRTIIGSLFNSVSKPFLPVTFFRCNLNSQSIFRFVREVLLASKSLKTCQPAVAILGFDAPGSRLVAFGELALKMDDPGDSLKLVRHFTQAFAQLHGLDGPTSRPLHSSPRIRRFIQQVARQQRRPKATAQGQPVAGAAVLAQQVQQCFLTLGSG